MSPLDHPGITDRGEMLGGDLIRIEEQAGIAGYIPRYLSDMPGTAPRYPFSPAHKVFTILPISATPKAQYDLETCQANGHVCSRQLKLSTTWGLLQQRLKTFAISCNKCGWVARRGPSGQVCFEGVGGEPTISKWQLSARTAVGTSLFLGLP